MLGFKAKSIFGRGAKKEVETSGTTAAGTPAPQTAEKLIAQRRQIRFGRTLSFVFDDNSIEMAAVSRIAGFLRLLGIRKVYVPSAEIGDPEGPERFINATIKEFIQEFGTGGSTIALSVTGTETAFRTFTMPQMSDNQLSSAIPYEIKKQLPFPINDCYYDYRPISRVTRDGVEQIKISLQGITKKLVDQRLTFFDNLDLTIEHVYNVPDVIGLLLRNLPDFTEETGYALINIERNRSQIAYYRGTALEFYHYFALGSSYLSAGSDKDLNDAFAELLSDEIQNSLEFYTGQFSTRFSNRVFIYGDMAYADSLVELLSSRFGFEFSRFPAEELSFLKNNEIRDDVSLPVCLPALATAVCDRPLANMLPPKRQETIKRRVLDRAAILTMALTILGFTFFWAIHHNHVSRTEEYLEELSHSILTLQNSQVMAEYGMIKQQVEIDQSYLNKVQERPSYLGPNLKELSRITPGSIRLIDLDLLTGLQQGNLTISGVVNSEQIPPEIILAEYIVTLKQSEFYRDIEISRHHKIVEDEGTTLEFTLKLTGVV